MGEEQSFIQHRVKTLHGMVKRISRWLKPGNFSLGTKLALVDPVALVEPPKGLEKGYVPIALYEGPTKPAACGSSPSPTPSPPPPSQSYVVADQSYACPEGYAAIQSEEGC